MKKLRKKGKNWKCEHDKTWLKENQNVHQQQKPVPHTVIQNECDAYADLYWKCRLVEIGLAKNSFWTDTDVYFLW